MNPQPIDLILSGKRAHVWTGGTGPVLLLLHSAWGDGSMSWAAVWDDLSQFFTVLAPDLPGFGMSEPLDEPALSANARWLKVLLDSQKAGRAIVVGNSFGAAVAIEFASSFPERIQHLVLVNGGYVPTLPGFIKKLVTFPALENRFRSLMRSMAYSDKALAKAFPNPSKLPQGFFDLIRQNEEKHSRNVFNTFIRQIKPQTPPPVPETVVWGTGDRLTSMKHARALQTWLGNADFAAIDGAGHMPQVESPGEFVDAIKKVGNVAG